MATSRTGTAVHKRMRRECLKRDRDRGVTACPLCLVPIAWDTSKQPDSPEADELVPYSLTGKTSTNLDEWQTICRLCNQRKGNRMPALPPVEGIPFPQSRQW